MNYLWELWGILGTFARSPRSRGAARPPRFASPVSAAAAAPQQQPAPVRGAAAPQQPPAAAPRGFVGGFVGFRDIRHKYVRFFGGTER